MIANATTFTTSDGFRLACTRWNETGSDVPVVLHHGFGANTQLNWVTPGIVQALLDQGRSIVAIDALGHGLSEKPHDAAHYGETRMARDLVELLDSLSLRRFDLFGYSMGAVVSLIVASTDKRVRRVVIGGVGEGVVLSGGVDMRVMHREALIAALLTNDPTTITHTGSALFRTFAERTGADLRALAAQAKRMHASAIDLQHIAAPTLVIAGASDVLAQKPERLAAAIPGATCVVVPGDHLGVVREPQFTTAAVEFLHH